jgi:hypothetical protein
MEQLAETTKANLLHVPYKGAAPAITDLMGGQVAAFFGDVPGLIGCAVRPREDAARADPDAERSDTQGIGGARGP